ncbi:MAG: TonB-dependent receptor [Cellvibrionaceae bacterium]|nr:TonB-dependent receptor [Cellvibrionaceae bacterium]
MYKQKALVSALALVHLQAFAQIEEVIVTATKQAQSTQDIPVAVSALGEDSLEQLGISSFNDYLVQMPGVTAGGTGPGQNTIYIRGIASTTPNLTSSGVAGLAPNVALYLDEQPLAQPGRNLDVYSADLNRVEVLKGPQGTLFGASSQAGTVRLITNKPDPSGISGKLKVGVAATSGGDSSNNFEAVLNLPISDDLALRGVVYHDKQGGYIDNVAGTRTARESARFNEGGFQNGADFSAVNFIEANNQDLAEKNFNKVTYKGGRLSALWGINEDWELLVAASTQTVESDGVFYVDPELDDLEIERFEEDKLEDEYINANWTLSGRIGALEAVYTGAFTEREADQRVDYTDYLFVGQYIPYYICDAAVSYPGDAAPSGSCQAPNLFVNSYVKTEVMTHELRFSTPQEEALRATFGAFYSDLELREDNQFNYVGSQYVRAGNGNIGFGPNYSAPGASVRDPGLWPKGVIWRNDVLRTDEQMGVFGELSYDISEQFSATFGARWYDIEVDLKGSAAGSFGNLGATADNNAGNNLDQIFSGANDKATTDGVIGKISLSWTPDSDQLYYFTWSEGFRPGFLNRPGGKVSKDGKYTVPFSFDTDDVTNYELGWKLDLMDGTLRINGDLFYVEVSDMQVGIFDPNITNLFFADNAADAEIKGLEADFIWAPEALPGLTISGAISLLDTEITDSFVTQFVQVGDELAFAPELQGNLQVRYEWDLANGYMAHVMAHTSYSDDAVTDIVVSNRTSIDSWSLHGLTAGVSSETWDAVLYADNISDERAQLSGNAIFNRDRINIARPRTVGVRFSYHF